MFTQLEEIQISILTCDGREEAGPAPVRTKRLRRYPPGGGGVREDPEVVRVVAAHPVFPRVSAEEAVLQRGNNDLLS